MADQIPLTTLDAVLRQNSPYVRPIPSTYSTAPDAMEPAFQGWLSQNKVPFNPDGGPSDYDMRGFYRALMQGDPRARAAIDPNDNRMHYPDDWKTPLHETFSSQSQWASPDAPQWNVKDQLVAPSAKILFDDKAQQAPLASMLAAILR